MMTRAARRPPQLRVRGEGPARLAGADAPRAPGAAVPPPFPPSAAPPVASSQSLLVIGCSNDWLGHECFAHTSQPLSENKY